MKYIMTTEANYLQTLTERIRDKVPYSGDVENIIKNNQLFFTAAGGAILTVVGLKFISKTLGFLAFVGGVTILYRSASQSPKIVEVLNTLAKPSMAQSEAPQILQKV
jgi:hypothetical protein